MAYYYYFPLAEVNPDHLGIVKTKTSDSFIEGFFVTELRPAPKLLLVHWQFPSQVNVISKTKDVEMNRSYNHIKRLVDRNDYVQSIFKT